jgi:hypothetical protein
MKYKEFVDEIMYDKKNDKFCLSGKNIKNSELLRCFEFDSYEAAARVSYLWGRMLEAKGIKDVDSLDSMLLFNMLKRKINWKSVYHKKVLQERDERRARKQKLGIVLKLLLLSENDVTRGSKIK